MTRMVTALWSPTVRTDPGMAWAEPGEQPGERDTPGNACSPGR